MIWIWQKYVSAMVFLWRRVHSAVWWLFHAEPKPKKARLLSPWEIAAIEIECGIEPSWTPPPVASLVTRTDASALNPSNYRPGGVIYLSQDMDVTIVPRKWTPPSAALIPVWSGCDDCETVETRRRGDPTPTTWLSRACPRHQEAR